MDTLAQSAAHKLPPLPVGVRLAIPGDQRRLREICFAAHVENGFGGIDPDEVERVIESACHGDRYCIALIDGPDRVEAVIGLTPTKIWYGTDNDWFWTDLLVYVRPEHRGSRHASRLLEFADWFADAVGAPVVLNVQPRTGLAVKTRFFARFGRLCGSIFVFGKV